MLEINIWELFVILIVALVVLGPEKLPKVAFAIGRFMQYFRNVLKGIEADFIAQAKLAETQKDATDIVTQMQSPDMKNDNDRTHNADPLSH
jgi:sec-independent protein translocase protein TatB